VMPKASLRPPGWPPARSSLRQPALQQQQQQQQQLRQQQQEAIDNAQNEDDNCCMRVMSSMSVCMTVSQA
jgi:hypothetical protein